MHHHRGCGDLPLAINTIKTAEDFSDMVVDCAQDMKRQNIIYREAMFDYTICYGIRGIPLKTVINGFADGLKTAKERYGTDIRFIANLDRTADAESNCSYLQELQKYRELVPIVAVGFDMKESGFPASRQKKALLMAREMGFLITGHAGEEAGPESIRDFLQTCEVDRIDHGVRAAEDEKLMEYLAERKLLCTLCPDSNLCLGVYKKWEEYPIRTLLKHNVIVSINSDDPPYFNYDLTGNLIKIAEQFSLSEDEIAACVMNALAYNIAGKEHLPVIQKWLQAYKAERSHSI